MYQYLRRLNYKRGKYAEIGQRICYRKMELYLMTYETKTIAQPNIYSSNGKAVTTDVVGLIQIIMFLQG